MTVPIPKRYVLGSTDPVTLDQDDSMRLGSLLPGATVFPAAAAAAAAARSGPAASPTDEALRSRAPGVAPAHEQNRELLICHAAFAPRVCGVADMAFPGS